MASINKYIVLGKGPSLDNYDKDKFEDHKIIGLNDVASVTPVYMAFFMDFEAYARNASSKLCENFAVPDVFNLGEKRMKEPSEGFLKRCDMYGPWVHMFPRDEYKVQCTVAEAAFRWLIKQGVSKIMSYGIDGGLDYHEAFTKDTRLKPEVSHDTGFNRLEKIVKDAGITWQRL